MLDVVFRVKLVAQPPVWQTPRMLLQVLQFAGQLKQLFVPSSYFPVPQFVKKALHYPPASAGAVEGQEQAPFAKVKLA